MSRTLLLSVCIQNAALAHCSFCLVPNSMHSVFSAFNTIRLASTQLYSGFYIVVSDRFISSTHLPAVYSVESSVYISKRMSGISRMESFMNMVKSKGPSIDPCGTPIDTGSGSESTPSYLTLWKRSDRYDLNHASYFPLQPYMSSLININS